jgi:DNA-binding GntR family transcriptional regulator
MVFDIWFSVNEPVREDDAMTAPTVRRARRPGVERRQLADEVAGHLRDLIMAGRLRPGDFVRLEDVAATLDVSITPVREALLTLRGEDMVELVPRRGYVVAPLSRQDIEDLFKLQADLAGELAARATPRLTAELLAELTEVQAALDAAADGVRLDEIEHWEFEFHRLVNRTAGSRKLSWFLHTATRYTPARFYSGDAGWRASMRTDHATLLRVFGEGDAEAARREMARHFTDGARRLTEHLDEIGLWSTAED